MKCRLVKSLFTMFGILFVMSETRCGLQLRRRQSGYICLNNFYTKMLRVRFSLIFEAQRNFIEFSCFLVLKPSLKTDYGIDFKIF